MKRLALALALVVACGTVWAGDMGDMHMGHGSAHEAASTKEYKAANMTMHKGMDIAFTGDADIDFLRGMIAHHQGAVDMAKVQLKYGHDARIKRMAQEVIRNQNLEIKWMKIWLGQLEKQKLHPNTAPQVKNWSDQTWLGDNWLGEE